MRLSKYILMLIVLFSYRSAYAQEHLLFAGKVVDKETKLALPFANVFIKGQATGTITNEDGDYVLKIEKIADTDTFQVSSLGYKNFYVPLSKLKKSGLIILLESSPVLSAEI